MIPMVWLDYQQAAPGRHRAGRILLMVGVLVAGWLWFHYITLGDEIAQAQTSVTGLSQTGSADEAGVDQFSPAAAPGNLAHWEGIFSGLESAANESMTLLSVSFGTDEIQISGEARDQEEAIAYVSRLDATKTFRNVFMTQSEVVRDHPQRPVRFVVRGQLRGQRS